MPQHPLQLLGRQPATEASPRVLLGAFEERRTEALVQAFAALLIAARDAPFWFAHDDVG